MGPIQTKDHSDHLRRESNELSKDLKERRSASTIYSFDHSSMELNFGKIVIYWKHNFPGIRTKWRWLNLSTNHRHHPKSAILDLKFDCFSVERQHRPSPLFNWAIRYKLFAVWWNYSGSRTMWSNYSGWNILKWINSSTWLIRSLRWLSRGPIR